MLKTLDAADPPQGEVDPQREARIRAAWIYYVEGRTQSEVAEELKLSRVAVTRLLSEARRRGEVSIRVVSPLTETVALERRLEARLGLRRAVVAPWMDGPGMDSTSDATPVIAAAAASLVASLLQPGMTVGVGWGRTLHAMLGHLEARPVRDMRVVSLLGGISEARRFNPAEFAWRFAETFEAEGLLVPAPALVDSEETRRALVDRCGLDQVFRTAERSDVALLSCGSLGSLNTSYRVGHLSEAERQSLIEAGAAGDVLYNFVDREGAVIDHPINRRAMSVRLERLREVNERVLVSGGADKATIMPAAIGCVRPTTLVTDEATARRLLGE